MSTTPILHVQNLRKTFGSVRAVRDISFDVHRGEIFGLLGPNGAGKTTTIQMLLDVLTPDAGTIEIFGQGMPVNRQAIFRQMNFSSTYVSLPWNMTVEESLELFGKLFEVTDIRTRVRELLELFEIAKFRTTLIGKLSSGQMTRVFMAKALINTPRLLLLDEPTASLDPDIADRVRTIIRDRVRTDGMSVLYTSHNMVEVEELCERIAFLNHGAIVASGTPDDVLRQFGKDRLEDLFIHFVRGTTVSQEDEA